MEETERGGGGEERQEISEKVRRGLRKRRGRREDKWRKSEGGRLRYVRKEQSHSVMFSVCRDRWLPLLRLFTI